MAKLIFGVDISKKTFDVAVTYENVSKPAHSKYSNDQAGFEKFANKLPTEAHIVMEASGSYYLQLATYLYDRGFVVSVINALTMSHFVRMGLHRSKTDKKDATYIAAFGINQSQSLVRWKPRPAYMLELQQLEAVIDNLTRQRTKLSNMREAFVSSGTDADSNVITILNEEISHVTGQMKALEDQMLALTEVHHKDLFERVKSIPGLGKRNVMMLIVITDGFKNLKTASNWQLM
jgi:transposase